MPSETEVISCPACRHLVRVPADWLGQTVQCPECKATFTAPTRAGDRLTDPVLLSTPAGPAPTAAPGQPGLLFRLPGFGLILVGLVGLVANGYLGARAVFNPDAARQLAVDQLQVMKQFGLGEKPVNGNPDQAADAGQADRMVRLMQWVMPGFAVLSGVVAAGGAAIVRRKNYRLAQFGCVLAALNLPHLCCVPGALFGLWGLMVLMSDDGREAFGGALRR